MEEPSTPTDAARPTPSMPGSPARTTVFPAPPAPVDNLANRLPGGADGIAAQAAKGAAKGGVAGAITGTAKGMWKNPKTRKLLLIGGILSALTALLGPAMFVGVVVSAISGATGSNQEANSYQAAEQAGVPPEALNAAYSDPSAVGVPAELQAWIRLNKPEFTENLPALGRALSLHLPDPGFRQLLVGTRLEDGVGYVTGDSDAEKRDATTAEEGFVTALTSEQFTSTSGDRLDEATAKTAYTTARQWAMGGSDCGASTPGQGMTTGNGPKRADGGTDVPGGINGWAHLNAEQTKIALDVLGATYTYMANATPKQRDHAAMIALSNAMRESTLTNVDHGDAAGPDSRGIFQQRDHWGPYEKRMTPTWATMKFLSVLVQDPNWDKIPQERASYNVQVFDEDLIGEQRDMWQNALPIFTALKDKAPKVPVDPDFGQYSPGSGGTNSGVSTTQPGGSGVTPTTVCGQTSKPVSGDFVSPMPEGSWMNEKYGMRLHPVYGYWKKHTGIDMLAPGGTCGAPLHAVTNGKVLVAENLGEASWGNVVAFEDAAGTVYWYAHIQPDGFKVKKGDMVTTGQVIALAGTTGPSTGCHLHFEVRPNGAEAGQDGAIDPVPYLQDRGITFEYIPG